jgi:hypothetical protein
MFLGGWRRTTGRLALMTTCRADIAEVNLFKQQRFFSRMGSREDMCIPSFSSSSSSSNSRKVQQLAKYLQCIPPSLGMFEFLTEILTLGGILAPKCI